MGPELVIYPVLFLALFFESFILVTFLSKRALLARTRRPVDWTPSVAIIAPCWNEGETIVATVESVLALDYPRDKLQVVIVDNASTDDTPQVIERFRANPQVTILREERQGKHHAMNAGIRATDAEIIGCLDADSFVDKGALREILSAFDRPEVAAATAAMSIYKPQNLLQHMQNAEYVFGIFLRHVLANVNGIHVTPGPFSLYRRDVILKVGGFQFGHQTEDMEMALRLQKAGYWIESAPKARVYTKAPLTVLRLVRQRVRWTTGFMRNIFFDYRDLIGNRKYGALGLLILPFGILSIGTGMLLFFVSIFYLVARVVNSYLIHRGIPYEFTLAWPDLSRYFDWFYAPITFLTLLTAVTGIFAIIMIMIGRRISGTPGTLVRGVIGFTLVYGLIAPFWLMRATADVVTGTRRGWR